MVRYLALDLPAPVRDLKIAEDLDCQILQREFFRLRPKLGPEVTPVVYQPVFEPEEALLCAIFVAPGETHLVFKDEVAPTRGWDEWYRAYRIQNLGRASDIESLEITDNEVAYHWCYSFLNLYETGMHYSGSQPWTGKIYSSTWNHMLTNKAQLPILLRGGYRKMEPEIYYGDRDAAEEYAKSL
ncbi:hypothetical protein ES708_13147 [subsurface metagenome]